MKPLSLPCLLLCTFFITTGAHAGTLAESHQNGITYLNGGIGDVEREEIERRSPDFNLSLLFTEKDGSYLTDVHLRLLDARGGTLVEEDSAGPFLLLRLPNGRYEIHASVGGQTRQRVVHIAPGTRQQRVFRW